MFLCVGGQLWNYVYFLIYLKSLHPSQRTPVENRIFDMTYATTGAFPGAASLRTEPDLSWMDLHRLPQWSARLGPDLR